MKFFSSKTQVRPVSNKNTDTEMNSIKIDVAMPFGKADPKKEPMKSTAATTLFGDSKREALAKKTNEEKTTLYVFSRNISNEVINDNTVGEYLKIAICEQDDDKRAFFAVEDEKSAAMLAAGRSGFKDDWCFKIQIPPQLVGKEVSHQLGTSTINGREILPQDMGKIVIDLYSTGAAIKELFQPVQSVNSYRNS